MIKRFKKKFIVFSHVNNFKQTVFKTNFHYPVAPVLLNNFNSNPEDANLCKDGIVSISDSLVQNLKVTNPENIASSGDAISSLFKMVGAAEVIKAKTMNSKAEFIQPLYAPWRIRM